MKKLLSDMMEWYKNLPGWKYVIYGGIIMGVAMWFAKWWIDPIVDKLF